MTAADSVSALDTSAAVAYLLDSHSAHAVVRRRLAARPLVLTGHSLAETYSVLTRMPGDARLDPADAARLIERNFGAPVLLSDDTMRHLPDRLAAVGISGGAIYDALVGLAALEGSLPLATRDSRALNTYRALGVTVVVAA